MKRRKEVEGQSEGRKQFLQKIRIKMKEEWRRRRDYGEKIGKKRQSEK